MSASGDAPRDDRGAGDGLREVVARWLGHDPLTGALNHRGLVERLQTALALARRQDAPVALVALALQPDEAAAGDRPGPPRAAPAAGDAGVAAAAVRELLAAVRDHDLVARLGPEEFVVVLQMCEEARALVVAARLLAELERVAGAASPVTWRAAAGVAAYPDDAEDVAGLLQAASVALARARAAGGGALAYAGGRA